MIYCKNVVNVALLKKKKNNNTQKISQHFSQQLSSKTLTSSHLSLLLISHFYLPLSICPIYRCEKFLNFFYVKKKKNYVIN